MPELPEVEIVKQSLSKKIEQKRIKKVIIKNRNLRFKIPLKFEKLLEQKKIKKVTRFSKYLILNFNDNSFCLIHLGMSGTIHLINKHIINKFTNTSFYNSPELPKKHNHVEIQFNDMSVIYNDPRRFGFFRFIDNPKELKKRFNHLGPEPFFLSFNLKYLLNFFINKKKDIKSFLLDQKFVSGIGNIYASEILFLCKINPKTYAMKLSKNDCKKIIYYSKSVLKKAIEKGGSSIRDFKNTEGKNGSFQKEFKVYQRENQGCSRKNCHGKIKKIFISNRSTFFCNICQK
ncbi:MAG: bifunctional DNA-formamidopyrimidine glycosylase/DNA-(apurinic or apyrimidinic site) lyase [Candidatus Pelagibacter bacterium]|jgi:formamidopyrimidine-DNA glycosylase|nr:bifunctional DNA-formamidopyrimidine glycosylase/DNA-(apurinic or apyrimidinic site) lyase [Candidatus Pelagibacter bacterium]MDA9158286.1 bifunctional DNA-formamidopyrimidine glycosylase/DNA-(apurinic or apyrimidinic site) lyase [Candidatus Pelagibacter sp.]|tara:strand:+ start:1107 stop:1970 length:864 start_codon:yes stop_codon:yes gene_type:complete